jgi:hypothetical protein
MNIVNVSLFDVEKVAERYSKKDGVPVKYVCTTALGNQDFAVDVFYRSTPHPEFGNHYFGIYRNMYAAGAQIMITNADVVEELDFYMAKDSDGSLHYSAHRHDYKMLENGNMIDGGRAYVRTNTDTTMFKVKDGEFQEVPIKDASGTGEEISKMEEQSGMGSEQRGMMGDLKFTTAGDYINGQP